MTNQYPISKGRVLCVLEAKREDLDPYYERADRRDAYRMERLPSRRNLDALFRSMLHRAFRGGDVRRIPVLRVFFAIFPVYG